MQLGSHQTRLCSHLLDYKDPDMKHTLHCLALDNVIHERSNKMDQAYMMSERALQLNKYKFNAGVISAQQNG